MRYHVRTSPPETGNEFVMSDGSVDRVGDVIAQDGWSLANFKKHPIALFNHERDQVIGKWADVAVKGGALTGRLELAEEGTSPLVDAVRKLVKQGILRAVSVGFRPLKKEKLTEDASDWAGPFRFLKSELLECSLVSIPANPNALSTGKALGISRDVMARIFGGEDEARTSAQPQPSAKARGMTTLTLSQKIVKARGDETRLKDQLAALIAKEEPDDNEAALIDELPGEIEAAGAVLKRLEAVEKALAPKPGTAEKIDEDTAIEVAKPAVVTGERAQVMAVAKRKTAHPGELFFRSIAVGMKSFQESMPLDQALRSMYGNDEALAVVLRAAVNPAQTTVAGWAAELVQTAYADFIDRLLAASIYNPLSAMGRRFDLGRAGSIKVPTRAGTPRAAGAWVGEAAPKPVKRIGLTPVTLTPHKLAVISTFTEEMALYSTPAIEALLRQALSDDTSEALDGYLIDNVASSSSRPAGLLNGLSTLPPSAASTPAAAMVADLKALVNAIVGAGGGRNIAILMNSAQAMGLAFAQTTTGDFLFESTDQAGNKFMARIIVSNTVPAGTVIAVDAADFATVTGDAPRFAISTEATLHEEDTTPLAIGTAGSPAVVAAPTRSLFQTDSVAIRLSLFVTWSMLRSGMVAFVTPVIW